MAAKKNAIEKRLDELVGLWNEFAEDPEARLLHWLADRDEMRMIDLFLETQNEQNGDVPDLFVRFDDPFENPATYGFTLVKSLLRQYDEIREGIREEDIDVDWSCPSPQVGESDIQALVRHCCSFREHYKRLMTHLVIVLTPESVLSWGAFRMWLHKLVVSGLPKNLRFMVVDDVSAAELGTLSEQEPVLVKTVEAKLDMPGATLELARDAPGEGPGFTFRRYYVALANAAGKGDLDAADRAAKSALRIAVDQRWLQMQVAVHMALGGARLGADKNKEAVASYRSAAHASRAAADQGDPVGGQLLLQSGLAMGAALFKDGQFVEAAKTYEKVAPIALKIKDYRMTIESWRMAAYCHEQAEDYKSSWRCGQQALDAGEKLDEKDRENTTLPYAAQGLIRITERHDRRDLADGVRQRMVGLMGYDWDRSLQEQQGAPPS